MTRSAPYQPLLLRILHGISSVLAIAAIITGYWVYATFDKRFGYIPLPEVFTIQGIHGTFGLFFLLSFPFFAIYSFRAGQKRLVQADSLARLTQHLGEPIWWISLQRLMNTLMLLAATFAVITGRMMQERWLPAGELNHIWYYLHLAAWLVFVIALLLHLLMSAKVGGAPLLLSLYSVKYRPEDSPRHWVGNVQAWLRRDKTTPPKN